MVTCSTQYGIYIEGKLTWFTDYRQAAQIEAAHLYGNVRRKLESGLSVILTGDMARQVAQAQNGEQTVD